jgi:cobalt-zinc-cadmium resistance protein CzcA
LIYGYAISLVVADIQDAIQTAVGGNALTQVLQGEQRYDLVLRYLPKYRDTQQAIENIRLLSPSGERVSLAQLCKIEQRDGASEIYREGNQRYIAIKYSVRGRDLGGAVEEAMKKVGSRVPLPRGYHIDWEGEYESEKRAGQRILFIVPLTILLIFVILYTMFRSLKWALLILANVALAPVGGMLALLFSGTHFSVSSGVGFLALFGVSVQTGVIMLEYINQLRVKGHSVEESAIEGAVLRLRPIMMRGRYSGASHAPVSLLPGEHSNLFEVAGFPVAKVTFLNRHASGNPPAKFRLVYEPDVDVKETLAKCCWIGSTQQSNVS